MKKILSLLLFTVIITGGIVNKSVKAEELTASNVDLIISFNNNKIDKDVEEFITKYGGQVDNELSELGSIEVKCKSALILDIKNYSSVTAIVPNHKIKLSQDKIKTLDESSGSNLEKGDLYNEYQWDIKKVTNNGKSFDLESGNHNVVVGIIDTGVNKNHNDLKANFLGGENFVPKGFEDDDTEAGDHDDINDRTGHGTHVAGTIAGNGRIMGVAPNIGFKSYRIFNSKGDTTDAIVSSAIIKATKDGVKVINLSIGGYDLKGKCFYTDPITRKTSKLDDDMEEYSIYKRAIKYAVDSGVTVVTSAGNDSLDCSNKNNVAQFINGKYDEQGFKYEGLGYEIPGTIKGVITVSATGTTNKISLYSNYGSKFIDIAAPGGDFINNVADMCLSTYKNGYTFAQGTSMAAPKVSAVAALIICKYGYLDSKDVAKRIYKSSESLEDDSNKYFGHGLVNAYNALN